jgi:spore maturation protein CgeB
MHVVIFCHSLVSDWNHGNAHFLRGVCTELSSRGHRVDVYEPADAWSVQNLLNDAGEEPLARFAEAYPMLRSTRYDPRCLDLNKVLEGADLAIVHEWNEPELVASLGQYRANGGTCQLLFHDTHHRSVTDPGAMARYDLRHYDGVLAFGESVAEVYRRNGWAERVWVWHEAADTRVFRPQPPAYAEGDLVWVGNWGDDERTAELHEFLIGPVRDLGLRARIHGVRYPDHALRSLGEAGIEYGGWLPNFDAPGLFARYRFTVHVPRGPYASALPGVPTIRVFEALACGIPLVSAPWSDSEGLFEPGADFLVARDGTEMRSHLRTLRNEPELSRSLAEHGLATIQARHTCSHRADELLRITEELQ